MFRGRRCFVVSARRSMGLKLVRGGWRAVGFGMGDLSYLICKKI
jgi:hypothetical protein